MDPSQLAKEIKSISGVTELHDLHIWSLDGEYHILTAHIVASSSIPKTKWVELKREIKEKLSHHGIGHATLEFEKEGDDCVQ
jgi:cobalt-zinc-cadmium efflux system protein